MLKNDFNGKKRGRSVVEEKKDELQGKKEILEHTVFRSSDLPDHHYGTVKDWLLKITDELVAFTESLVKKAKNEKNSKVFLSDRFSVNDINNSLFNLYKLLDSSVEGFHELRCAMCEYVSTWKVALQDALLDVSSDSSVEILENGDLPSDKEGNSEVIEVSDKIKGTKDECSKSLCSLRIRKPSEVNRLMEELSNECFNNVDVCEDIDEVSVEQEDISGTKIVSSENEILNTKINSLKKDTSNTKIDSLRTEGSGTKIDFSEKDTLTAEIDSSSKEKNETKTKGKSTINWDTSSESEESGGEWLMASETKNSNNSKSKNQSLKKKTERKSKKKDSAFSSSSDDFSGLCNLKSLTKKKRKRKFCNSSNDSTEENKSIKSKEKKKVNRDSLLDFMDGNHSEDSDSIKSEELFTLNVDRCKHFFGDSKEFKAEDFLKSDDDERSISVISDSSLDSIVEALRKTCKVKRGSDRRESKAKNQIENDKVGTKIKKGRRKRDRLLDEKLSDTDSSEAEKRWNQSKMKKRIQSDSEEEGEEVVVEEPEPKSKKSKNKKPRKTLFSDSDENLSESSSSEENEESDKESETEKKPVNNRKRKRIQRASDTSDSDGGEASPSKSGDGKGRKNIRKVLKEESLEKSTKEALKEEEERKKRILEKQSLYNELIKKASEQVEVLDKLVLDFDVETKEPLVSVDKDLVKKLKPHQAEGVKFMWDSCFESVKEAKKSKGSGCILAHCMGLGKTLQVITFAHTLLTCKEVDIKRILVVCPLSTVQNWVNEFHKWLKDVGSGEDIEVYNMIKTAPNHRVYQLRDWERTGGVMVLGYNMFRSLAAPKGRQKASVKKAVEEMLLDPGPDVVVCDEGHILKNEKTAISVVMNKLATRRRIVLTGTPLQNNLVEYHCMVQFVKPNLLGTRKEFQNRFVHPITNGQFEDSTTHDVKVMKRRAHVLHKMLDGIVQRKDYSVLTPYLPPKYEYVIHVKLSDIQIKLYRHYLINFARAQKNEGGCLFSDFQNLMRICTHPRALLLHSDKEQLKLEKEEEDSEGSIKDFIDDDSEEDSSSNESSSNSSGSEDSAAENTKKSKSRRVTRAQRAAGEVSEEEVEELPAKRNEWWSELVTDEELEAIKSSSKLFLFFTILKHCEEIGDKLLVFSQSLYTLDLIEYFLQQVDDNNRRNEEDKNPGLTEFSSSWDKGIDYFRLDGATNSDCRNNWCKVFNSPKNVRGRLFLISTKAGGLGINLTGANRVIIFDASWNPSFDVQSMFRVFRFGQDKPCYIYRFLSKGTMEEKIYERQVAKLSTSLRVIDEQQIDRHFSQTSLAELYAFNPEPPESRETPVLPKDRLMAELLQAYPDVILTYHQHDSLLENQEAEELNEEERKAAWLEFENEKNHVPPPMSSFNANMGMNMNYFNQFRTGATDLQFAMEYNNILNILVQKVRMGNPQMPEEAVRKRAAEILAQQTIMQSYMQQQQQQQQMLAGWQNQMPSQLVNLPLRGQPTPQPFMNNLNKDAANASNAAKKNQGKPELIEIHDD